MPQIVIYILLSVFCMTMLHAQKAPGVPEKAVRQELPEKKKKVLYGIASYYADKFHGRLTANGEIYDRGKLTAACNVLPLGTWIRVTNLRNNKSVIVKTNDRMHPRMKRVVDLSRVAAEKLGYIKRGLTQVKVELIGKPKDVALVH